MDLGTSPTRRFKKLKAEIATPTALAYYDVLADTKYSADASSHGLGAVLLQLYKGTWRPVAFDSVLAKFDSLFRVRKFT